MKIVIENVETTKQQENFEIINRTLEAVKGQSTIEGAYMSMLRSSLAKAALWSFGRGGDHIWVSNGSNERLIIIT